MGILKYKEYSMGSFSHVFNRGNNKQAIFLDTDDYLLYIKKLKQFREKYNVSVLAYCLMPTHVHLLLRQNNSVPIFKFISSLHTSYAMIFNKKYERVGHLFQDRFKMKIINDNKYLRHLIYYINLNPVIDNIVNRASDYKWSSYNEYIYPKIREICDMNLLEDLSLWTQGQSFDQNEEQEMVAYFKSRKEEYDI